MQINRLIAVNLVDISWDLSGPDDVLDAFRASTAVDASANPIETIAVVSIWAAPRSPGMPAWTTLGAVQAD